MSLLSRGPRALFVLGAFGCAFAILKTPIVQRWVYGPGRVLATPDRLTIRARDGERDRTIAVELSNVGGGPVTILDASSKCGCTVVRDIKGTVLAPGTSFWLTASVRLPAEGYEKDSAIEVIAASPELSLVRVPLRLLGKARRPPFIVQTPPTIYLNCGGAATRRESHFTIRTVEPRDRPAWITGFDSSPGQVNVRIDQVVAERQMRDGKSVTRRYEVAAIADGSDVVGRGLISLVTEPVSREAISAIPWQVSEHHIGIRGVPRRLTVAISDLNRDTVSRKIVVRCDNQALALADIECDQDWITAVAQLNRPATTHIATVTIHPRMLPDRPDEAAGRVLVRTSEGETVTVPVKVFHR